MSFLSNLLFGAPPPAPDYAGAAQVQGQENIKAAQINAAMNRMDETTPYGSVDYTSTANPNTPGGFDYGRNISLSPEQQQLYDLESGNAIKSQEIAQGLQGGLEQSVAQPFSLGKFGQAQMVGQGQDPMSLQGPEGRDLGTAANYAGGAEAVGKAMYDRMAALREPGMKRDRDASSLALRNQGFEAGSEGSNVTTQELQQAQGQELNDLAMRATLAQGEEQSRLAGLDMGLDAQRFGQGQTGFENQMAQLQQSLMNRLNTAGFNNQTRGQNIQEGLLERQQPLAEYNAFRTGNAPTLPTFQPYGMTNTQAAPTYQAQKDVGQAGINKYNQKQAGLTAVSNIIGNIIPG